MTIVSGWKDFGHDAGLEPALRDLVLVVFILGQDFAKPFDEQLLRADDENFVPLFFFEFPERHAVFLEEPDELFAGNAAVLTAGDTVSAEPAAIEPLGHGPGRDLTDLRDLTRREHFFHWQALQISLAPRRSTEPPPEGPWRRGTTCVHRGATEPRQTPAVPIGGAGLHRSTSGPSGRGTGTTGGRMRPTVRVISNTPVHRTARFPKMSQLRQLGRLSRTSPIASANGAGWGAAAMPSLAPRDEPRQPTVKSYPEPSVLDGWAEEVSPALQPDGPSGGLRKAYRS